MGKTIRGEERAGLRVRLFKDCDLKEEDSTALCDFMVEATTFIGSLPKDEPIDCDHFIDSIEDLLRNDYQQQWTMDNRQCPTEK